MTIRHLARVSIAPEVLLGLIIDGRHIYEVKGIPQTASVVSCHVDQDRGSICLVLEDEQEFEPVQHGDVIPLLPPPTIDTSAERIYSSLVDRIEGFITKSEGEDALRNVLWVLLDSAGWSR